MKGGDVSSFLLGDSPDGSKPKPHFLKQIVERSSHPPKVQTIVKPGCSQDVLKAALSAMASVTEIFSVMSSSSNSGVTPF
ncbi:pyrophosphate--fructose 6-phosphate 1-phosphotransferase subunit alpha-like [Camellia sinensis]|uniref:pyrophosphate--fructose 6-phosphate 1-phosphotransferase subunit alpha-like n=1 Tax=Camellia sinensis TaxID=4442 RepID=UPI001036E807|nr:pyrophosphate--fructose 6-phosphate 1-phosphotransferase subunit alpha-like [Camellia sinensis]